MKKILLPLGAIGTIIAPIVTVIACGSSSTPTIKDDDKNYDQPKVKTQQEINEENIKALEAAKQHLANIDVSWLNTINLKPSLFLVADIDGKDVLKQYLQVDDDDLKLFDDMQIDVAVSNIDDTNGNLTITIQLAKGDKEPQTMSVSKDLTNFLNHSSYEKYLDQKFFDDMEEIEFKNGTIYPVLTPIKTSWKHSTNWWQSSYHHEYGFDYTYVGLLLQNLTVNKDLNANDKAIFKKALFQFAGAEKLPPELAKDDVKVLSSDWLNINIGYNVPKEKEGFDEKGKFLGWTNGYVSMMLEIQKGQIRREVVLFVMGWIPWAPNDPHV